MPRKRGFVTVTNRQQSLRITTSSVIRAQETVVDLMTGSVGSSLFDLLDLGLVDLIENSDYGQRYFEEEEEYNCKPNQTQKLNPHPQLKELDDEYTDTINPSLEEDKQKRQSKSNKNKRKKMRKRERKRQEKEDGPLQEEEQGKSDSSEYEEVNGETSVYETCAENSPSKSEKITGDNYNNEVIVKEETNVQLNKKEDIFPENIQKIMTDETITETILVKKSKYKSKHLEKTQAIQIQMENLELKPEKLEKDKIVTDVNVENESEESRIVDEGEHEEVVPVLDKYTIRSRELAAFGNRLAANEQYDAAIQYFTEAIKFNPQEYKLFGNRSFCFEKMQQFDKALCDAEISLSMEPNWIKGLFRKGKALCGLKKYYEASLAYRHVLKLDGTSEEAAAELKRSQSLHLMEMGFTLTQSLSALEKHPTLEEAIEALFHGQHQFNSEENVFQSDVSRAGHIVDDKNEWENAASSTKDKPIERAQPITLAKRQGNFEVFPVWVGSLAPSVSYVSLQEVFSRVGKVFSIKMVLEHQCAFVHYSSQEECARAVETLNGLVLEGCPLSVRYPNRIFPGTGISKQALTDPLTPPSVEKECFFWRTIGCTRDNCTFQHVPQKKGIDRGKFTQNLNGSSISS